MYDQSNIEFINFDTMTHPDYEQNIEMNIGGLDISNLNDILLDRYESGNESQYNSFFTDSRSQFSFSLEFSNNMLNDSITSSVDQISSPNEIKREETLSCFSDKPFECEEKTCKKRFKFKWILDRHYSAHESIKMFKCDYVDCLKSYKSKENLTLHFKNIHLHQKPYSCNYCTSVFSHRNDCMFCFASKSALTYHLKSHHSDNKKKKIKNFRSKFVKDVEEILNLVDNVDLQDDYCMNGVNYINCQNLDPNVNNNFSNNECKDKMANKK